MDAILTWWAKPSATKTAIKYLFWYGVAATSQQALQIVGNVGIPDIYVPIAAAVLKAIATFVQVQLDNATDIQ